MTGARPRSSSARNVDATPTRATSSRSASSSMEHPCAASGAGRTTGRPWTRSSTGSSAGRWSTSNGRAIGARSMRWPVSPPDAGLGWVALGKRIRRVRADARVVKVKRFAIEPMFEEDAVARMEELGHAFFIFVNAENERLGVLYRTTRRALRPHRAGRRRRVHDKAAVAPERTTKPTRPTGVDGPGSARGPTVLRYQWTIPPRASPREDRTAVGADPEHHRRDGHVDTRVVNGVA